MAVAAQHAITMPEKLASFTGGLSNSATLCAAQNVPQNFCRFGLPRALNLHYDES
jgi:hypothetical protein